MTEEVVVKGNEVNITENISKATEVAFCFDTTGSMSSCIGNVRSHMEKTVEEMFELVPNLKVAFIAHGDYCDGDKCYDLLPLTDDKSKIYNFIRNTPNTGGGDEPECYELALNLAKGLGWSDAKGGKILVMIGDAPPHEPDFPENKDHLDWRKELADLKAMGVDVYPLQCLYSSLRPDNNNFWSAIAEAHGTPLMKLDDMNETAKTITGVACASSGSATFGLFEKSCLADGKEYSAGFTATNSLLRAASNKYDDK